ncbi:MAG: hypothetical protein AAF086_09685 [Planctomycetota bacterium]
MKTLLPTIALTAAAALAFAAPAAQAGSTAKMYDLRGNGGLAKAHTFVHSDVTITAHASAQKGKRTSNAHVGQYRNGLGVTNSVKTYKNWKGQTKTYSTSGDGHFVDGKGHDDTLWLDFSSPFKITGAVFTYIGKYSEGVTVVDAHGKSLGWHNLSSVRNKWGVAHLDLTGLDYTGDSIGFKATGNYDAWKVAGVKGHAVPTPSAAAAGLLGLAAISARRRRKTEVETVSNN